jgi:ATP-dependent DNA helicase RecG
MTATPIPRSLALALYGDLAISILDELPPGRQPIQTVYITPDRRAELYQRVRDCLDRSEQVFIVAPRITEDGELESDTTSVEREYARWQRNLPGVNVAQLHGQLKAAERQAIMHDFRHGKIAVLIATTVIEVGVDIPNATLMIIENADRFGMAQLHQLRGRVGRSDKAAVCFVCSDTNSSAASERLQFFAHTTSGFALAEYDLEQRGPGDVYGQDQSGFLTSLKVARLTDQKLLYAVRAAADKLYPQLSRWPLVEQRVNQFMRSVHLE